jgi:hypothetical protein
MPYYSPGFQGEFTNKIVLPETLNHVSQFLTLVSPSRWKQITDRAAHLRENPGDVKLKPSALQKIENEEPNVLVQFVHKEHVKHANPASDFVLTGGVHDSILQILTSLAAEVGGNTISDWVGLENNHRVSPEHLTFAQLLRFTYRTVRPDVFDDIIRLEEYDTPVSCLWFDGMKFIVTVVSPPSGTYENVKSILREFIDEYAQSFIAVTHGGGLECFLACGVKPALIYAFSPEVPTTENKHKTTFFVNPASCSRALEFGVAGGANVIFSHVVGSPAVLRSLAQWAEFP